ncbi:Ribosome quality control complex subunit 1 [Lachnellula arida]|uniref:Ribosome quality control complex subunit 1 n=1 Tax=Lachnellula arida TaxID=1316785 RepID=A0A8T9B542_9HELO|nr:Ribosome quality control complex subunit 1 [Lachnellula arida]
MSTRQLRKLQQQRELEQAQLQAAQQEESEDEPVLPTKSKPSLFANLAALEDAEDDEDEAAEEEPAAELSEAEPTPLSASKKPKKSKKKKKSKGKAKEKGAESQTPQKPENGADEIDAALRELNLKKTAPTADSQALPTDPEYEKICTLLGVNTQHLKVANEMRALFGKAATEIHDDPGGPTGRGARRRQRAAQNQQVDLETALKGHHLPGKGLPELTLRRNNFIQGKDDWPKAPTGGLTMEVIDDPGDGSDGSVEFTYSHNIAYQIIQQTFSALVEMGDPQNLIGLLVRNPYHISSLLQVSKIAKDQGDHALSSDLIERALFTFGRASLTQFNNKITKGYSRLDFLRPENRELWLAGYQYIKSLIMKGTYRTALEWAKLLSSLDPEDDPYCMRFMIHHLALRAQEFTWLLDLYESQLPPQWSAFDENGDPPPHPAILHFMPSLAFAALRLRDGVKSRKLLTESMKNVPWLFVRLFKELNLDAPSSIWGIEPRTDAETLFTEMYVLQTKDLWNAPEAVSLLMEVAHTIPKVNIEKIMKVGNSEMTLDVVRFVYLENIPALMALVPSSLLHKSNNSDSDPIPPEQSIYSYEAQRKALEIPSFPPGFGHDFMDPLEAIARLLPNLRGAAADGDIDRESLRRGLEEAIINEGPEELDDDGWARNEEVATEAFERPIPFGLARRLMNMFWPGRGGDGVASDGDEDEDIDTETDEDMPGLVGAEESDDEMPDLIEPDT